MRLAPRNAALVLVSSVAVIALALVGLFSPTSAADDEAQAAKVFLDRVAGTDKKPYRARQLVVYFGAPQSAAMVDVQSSGEDEFVRAESGPNVTKLWKHAGSGIVSAKDATFEDESRAHVTISPEQVLAKYDIDVGKREKFLGVDVVPLTLRRRSDGTVVERWLVHPQWGIVYQRRFYNERSKLVGMSTIIEMNWGDAGTSERFDPGTHAPEHVREMVPHDVPHRLAHRYHLTSAYRLRVAGRPAEHFVYSDGLHALSVFRTSGRLRAPSGFRRIDLGPARGYAGPGPGTWAWEGRGKSYLMVAEEPALAGAEMTGAFPRGGRSTWARMGSVWAKIFHGIGRALP